MPFGWPGAGTQAPDKTYSAFSSAGPPTQRTSDPENDFVELGIGINPTENYVRWYVNGEVVYQVNRPGIHPPDEHRLLEHGGPETESIPSNICIGFGTFSLLGMALPYNYARELVNAPFVSNQAESALVQLEYDEMYAELLPGTLGEPRDLIDPSTSFAVILDTNPPFNMLFKLFGQGATLRVTNASLCFVKNCSVDC